MQNSTSVSKPVIIAIEGNIGAGKSTLLRHLKESFDQQGVRDDVIQFMQEPVDLWESVRDETGETILAKFYRDQEKYAFAFQIMAYTSRLAAFKRLIALNPGCKVIVCERSLDADRNIFAKMMRDDGTIDSVSHQVYEMLFKNTSWEFETEMVVYMDTDPEKCIERIGLRAREGESIIQLGYLAKCKKYYDEWMSHMCEHSTKTVVHIDSNVDTDYQSSGEIGPQWVELIHQLAKSFI